MFVVELLGLVRAGHVNAEYGESVCVFVGTLMPQIRSDSRLDMTTAGIVFFHIMCTPTTATSKCGCGGKAAVGDCSVRVVWV